MKVLFVIPSLRRNSPTKFLPVGIASVMTFLDEHGYKFDVLDIDINDYDDEYVENYIKANEYDVVLTGSIVTHYKWMKWLTSIIKQYHPNTKIIVGNSVGGSAPEVFLRNSKTDVVIVGEGEFATLDVMNHYRDGAGELKEIEGIAFINDAGKFIQTAKRKACKIDDLPMVNWDLLEVDKYFEKSDHAGAEGLAFDEDNPPRVMPVATARGCAFKCTFCHYVYWDDPYRHRSSESILAEIKRNIEKYDATYINFWDDLSFASLTQVEKLCDAILESGLKFNWNCAIRIDLFGNPRFTPEKKMRIAQKMRESGCLAVGFSLESGDQEILEMMNKKIKSEFFYEQVRIMKEVGISCSNSVVFGYPIETKETINKTFSMCLEAGIYPSIGFLMPLPYTGMYEYAKSNGFITDENEYLDSITERQDITLNMTKLSDEEIMTAIKNGARELNEKLALGLDEKRFIRTGGYRKHTKKTAVGATRKPLDPENVERHENDFSFNYSQAVFDMDLGTGTVAKAKQDAAKKDQ